MNAIRYDVLYEYAQLHRLDYNELCRMVRGAHGVKASDSKVGGAESPMQEKPAK